MTSAEERKALLEVAEAIKTMKQDYSDLNAANVKLGTDLMTAWIERDRWRNAHHALNVDLMALQVEVDRLREPCIECGGTTGRDCEPRMPRVEDIEKAGPTVMP